jgi:HAE1 family hydrophobic/amphiphilic exporter-1
MGNGSGAIDLYLRGEDNDVLLNLAEKIKARIAKVPGVMNPALSSKAGKAEYVFTPNRKHISADGLSVEMIAGTLRSAVDGLVTTTYKEGGREYDIRVVLKRSALQDLEDIKNIPIAAGPNVRPLSYYTDVGLSTGYSKIMRTDKIRTVEISADLLPGYAQGVVLGQVLSAAKEINLPAGYSLKQAGSSDSLAKTVRDLITVFLIALVLTYLLLAAILESFTQPLFILSTVPLALIGVVLSLMMTGAVLNFVAMLAVIMLVGIVVYNAILILDYYSQLKRQGMNAREALLVAAPTKLKPILMSNIAIILGMLPMAMGIGASGAEMRAPMGIVTIGGIISSTIMTLYLIPALENLLSRMKNKKESL